MAAKKDAGSLFDIQPIAMSYTTYRLLGTTALIMNRYAQKAIQELLFPDSNKKNKAARAEHLKHDPLQEYRDSMYRNRNDKEPTLAHFPQGAFSKAMAAAALDVPGASKAEILRLVSVDSEQVNIFGTPTLGMAMVRSSNMARTPDVRTRAYFPQWCCEVKISYPKNLIGPVQVANLLSAAGHIVGLGDWRPQKGGTNGRFQLVEANDQRYNAVMRQAREAQEDAYNVPDFFDEDSEELFAWFIGEVKRREKTTPSAKTELKLVNSKKNGKKLKKAA